MKKQQGFTLIELMVVMAIIAILATAGLSAYTGYIKKARDTKRISDLAAMNTIVIGQMTTTGLAPLTVALLKTAINAANNDKMFKDPLTNNTTTVKSACLGGTAAAATTTDEDCAYMYKVCENGAGFNLATRFESSSNTALYTTDTAGSNTLDGSSTNISGGWLYEVGNCSTTPAYDITNADAALDDILDND